jgi:hypothetical protein
MFNKKNSMPITPSANLVIPEVPARTADVYWLQQLVINAPSLTDKVECLATLVPYSSTTGEMFPERKVVMVIDDVLTKCGTDTSLANTVDGIFAEVDRQAKMQNLI